MNNPFFSIVMPSFNQSRYIVEAIQSVIDQSIESWELIIVDNNSSDETLELVQALKDPRIKILTIKNDGVIAKSRNKAISNSLGKYIAFLDSDDSWRKDKLEKISGVLTSEKLLVYHSMTLINAESEITGQILSRRIIKPHFEDLVINGNPIVNSSVVVSKEALLKIGLLDESIELIGVEDYNAWLRLCLTNIEFIHLDETLGSYRVHGQSTSSLGSRKGLPTQAFRGLDLYISEELIGKSHARYWEIEAKSMLKMKSFRKATQAFQLSTSHSVYPKKIELFCLMLISRSLALLSDSNRFGKK
jgi:glycosyltransferase involved in cell wall biosynthesis